MDSNAIRELRCALGLPRLSFGKFLGVTEKTVTRWEDGTTQASGLPLLFLQTLALARQRIDDGALRRLVLAGITDMGSTTQHLFTVAHPPARTVRSRHRD